MLPYLLDNYIVNRQGFPRISHGRRLAENLVALTEDLTPLSGPTTVLASGSLVPDNETLHGIPWIRDDDIIEELLLNAMYIPPESLRSIPYGNNNNASGSDHSKHAGPVDPVKFLACMMESGAQIQDESGLILRLGDVCARVEKAVERIHQMRQTFLYAIILSLNNSDPGATGLTPRQIREVAEEATITSCLMDSRNCAFIDVEKSLGRPQHVVIVQFFSNPRSKYVLDIVLRLYLNLLIIAVIACDQKRPPFAQNSPGSPTVLVNLPYVLRCISHLAWIRWGWHTKDKRDLYLALDCLEEAIINDDYDYRESILHAPFKVAQKRHASHLLRLSQYYRLGYGISGCMEDLRGALNWARVGLELLLDLEKLYYTESGGSTSRDTLRFQIICAQYDLSRLFDMLWAKTSNPDDGAAAHEMARRCIQHLDSQSSQLPGDIERKLRRNYSYCRCKYHYGFNTMNYSDFVSDNIPFVLGGASSYSSLLHNHCQKKSLSNFWESSDSWDANDLDAAIALLEGTLNSVVVRPEVDSEGCEALAQMMSERLRRDPFMTYFNVDQARQVFRRCSKRSQIGCFATLYERTRDKEDREVAYLAFLKSDNTGVDPRETFKAMTEVAVVAVERSLDICQDPDTILQNVWTILTDQYAYDRFNWFMKHLIITKDVHMRGHAISKVVELGYGLLFTLLEAGQLALAEYVFDMVNEVWPSCSTSGLPQTFSELSKHKFRPSLTQVWFTPNTREMLQSELADLVKPNVSMGARWKAGVTLLRLWVSGWIPEEWHHERLESLKFLLGLIPYNFNFTSRLQERTMYKDNHHGLNIVDFLTRQSASVAEYGGTPSQSLEVLEMSRGIILNNVITYRGELDYLFSSHPQYARELRYLIDKLDEGFAGSEPEPAPDCTEKEFRQYLIRAGQRVHDAHRLGVLQKVIQRLDGYKKFMSNEYAGDSFAQRAAEEGPIIFVSAWKQGHAIIVTKDSVQFLPLDRLNQEEASHHLAKFLADPERSLSLVKSQKSLRTLLKWLWDVVVEPILEILGMLQARKAPVTARNVLELPRIWWIGVGVMTHAPFHAAGRYPSAPTHRAEARYTARYCVSSYTSTIKTLMHARHISPFHTPETKPVTQQNTKLQLNTLVSSTNDDETQINLPVPKDQDDESSRGRSASNNIPCDDDVTPIRALLVAMPLTPTEEQRAHTVTPLKVRGSVLGALSVAPEIATIKDILEAVDGEVCELWSPEADVVSGMVPSYNIIHFACHGEVNQSNPLQSRLVFQRSFASQTTPEGADTNANLIRDYLTVGDILRLRRSDSGRTQNSFNLVYLSACSSASNRCLDMSDEPLHIASVFLLAGFNHAIGTLWDSEDEVCVEVAQKFYEHLGQFLINAKSRQCANTRPGSCAEALHLAVDHVRNKYWHAPYKWASFMHWGA